MESVLWITPRDSSGGLNLATAAPNPREPGEQKHMQRTPRQRPVTFLISFQLAGTLKTMFVVSPAPSTTKHQLTSPYHNQSVVSPYCNQSAVSPYCNQSAVISVRKQISSSAQQKSRNDR
ncbi:UNVERIFIED_CONTAM: hypothetical protein FKN15_064584 [Acipenser sinensis]